MSSREGQDDAVIGADLLAQLQDNATVLGVFDECRTSPWTCMRSCSPPPPVSGHWRF